MPPSKALRKHSTCASLGAFFHVRNLFCMWIDRSPCWPPLLLWWACVHAEVCIVSRAIGRVQKNARIRVRVGKKTCSDERRAEQNDTPSR